MSDLRAIRCVVAGRVQGVYYRASTVAQAQRLKLNGWVKNCSDGRVEVVAAGESAAVAELAGWLWSGPPAARVDAVQVEEWTGEVRPGFVVAG